MMRASRILPATLVLFAALPDSVLAAGAEGGEGGLFDINTGLSAWTLIVFTILIFVLGRYAWKPILEAVEAREQGIQSSLDEAARRNEEAAGLLAQHKEQLSDARRQANELIAEGKAAGETVRKDIEEKARAEAQAIVDRALAEIERERDAALESLRKETVDLALSAASRLMQESLDQDKDRALVERYLSDMADA